MSTIIKYIRSMKFFTKIVLVIFILFQFSSVIICIINEKNESKFSYTITEEEEQHKNTKQIISEYIIKSENSGHLFTEKASKEIPDFYLLKNYRVNSFIDLLPPEQV